MTIRFWALAVALLMLPALVPATAADGPGLHIPVPREGDRITYDILAWSGGNAQNAAPLVRHVNWTSPLVDATDGFGAAHRAYAMESVTCRADGWCGASNLTLDAQTRATLRFPTVSGGWTYSIMMVGYADHRVTYESLRSERVLAWSYESYLYDTYALHGQTLEPGQVVTLTPPPSPHGQASGLVFQAIGWEDDLFRVEGTWDAIDGNFTLWFDGAAAVPVRSYARILLPHPFEPGETMLLENAWTLSSREAGEGMELLEAGYVSPRPTSRPTPRSTVGADGPDEPMSRGVPLAAATTALRTDLRTAGWFDEHPDAVLVLAAFEDDHVGQKTTWRLHYASATGGLRATVEGAMTPPPNQLGIVAASSPLPASASPAVPADAACVRAAEADVAGTIAFVSRSSGLYSLDADGVTCKLRLDEEGTGASAGEDGVLVTGAGAVAIIDGASGGLRLWGHGEKTSRTTACACG